jgi:hypothetical protein
MNASLDIEVRLQVGVHSERGRKELRMLGGDSDSKNGPEGFVTERFDGEDQLWKQFYPDSNLH